MLNPINDSSISNHRHNFIKKRIRSTHSHKPSKPNPSQPLRYPRLAINQRLIPSKQKNKLSKSSLKKKIPSRPDLVSKSRSKSKVVVEKKKALSKLKELEEDISSL